MAVCLSRGGSAHGLAVFLVLVLLTRGIAVRNETDTFLYRVGFSHVGGSPSSHRSRAKSATGLQDEPGPDIEPEGIKIYDHKTEVPDYDIQPGDAEPEKCYVETRKFCVKASYCGRVCEPVRSLVRCPCWL
jgi:hypothetical protein